MPDTPTPTRTAGQRFLALCLVLVILAIGGALATFIIKNKPTIQKTKPQQIKIPVETVSVAKKQVALTIEAMGTVISAQTLELKPSVSGTIQTLSPLLVPGGILHKDDVVMELDTREFQLNYERSKNTYEQAAMDLRIEEGSQAVAKREYQLLQELSAKDPVNIPKEEIPQGLALREPQLAQAQAAKAAALTEMEIAGLNLERTTLHCPFNAVVLEKMVAPGAQVNTQTTIAKLAGIDTFWVRIAIPQEQLAQIRLPEDGKPGASVDIVRFNSPKNTPPRKGVIIKLLREVDEKGLMARLLIAIDQPTRTIAGAQPLLLGSVVKAKVPGIGLPACFQIPQKALHAGSKVYIATKDNTLDIRQVGIIWQNDEMVYIDKGLSDNDQVITSPIATPVKGMALTIDN